MMYSKVIMTLEAGWIGIVVKPRTLGGGVPGSSLSRVTVRCSLKLVTLGNDQKLIASVSS